MAFMDISDWVLVGTTLFLGAIAIFSTYLAEIAKRRLFAPRLAIKFDDTPPYCHRTAWRNPSVPNLDEPVYFFYFQLENEGKSQARLCEIILEELWIYDASDRPIKYQSLLPISFSSEALNINPHRKILVAIGHISSPNYQKKYESKLFIDIPGNHKDSLRFMLDLKYISYRQPNCFVPGKYAIKVSTYSENAPPKEKYFKIACSGNWQLNEADMFRELVIQGVESL
jgi:hypothetical protein